MDKQTTTKSSRGTGNVVIKTHAFHYEDFCKNVAEYLKEHELEFVKHSPEQLLPNRLDKNMLELVLAKYWQGL